MKIDNLHLWLQLCSYSLFVLICYPATAQIVPDNTLPVNSRVTDITSDNLSKIHQIDGGTNANGNLFHSFQQFSLPQGHAAFFNNSLNIQNIITRVTGGFISNINGLIQTNGTANLFLLNPNGIIFGPNAQLNIGGSFIASTAQAIKFADGTQFNTNPASSPLLTISVPIGLQLGNAAPAPIVVQGANLQVSPGQNISLVGGQINLNGGSLKAEKGRIELAAISDGSWSIFGNNQIGTNLLGDIQLSEKATVDVSGTSGGEIEIQARNLRLTDASQIKANTLGTEPGGNITVNTSESVEVIGRVEGVPSALQARVEAGATGNGGNININTRSLRVEGGARIAASSLTDAPANAGNLTIKATDAVEVIGAGNITNEPQVSVQPSALSTQTTGAGNAGKINIQTGQLIAREGGQVSSETFAAGKAGDITLKANQVLLDGRSYDGTAPSGILARTTDKSTGNAGNVSIETGNLTVSNGARVAASSLGTGSAGKLNILAQDTIEVTGVGKNAAGSVNPTQISVLTTGSGEAGSLSIQTGKLIAQNGGQITASTQELGDGGTITVNADEVQLIGRSPDGSSPSGVLARVEPKATGNAGDVVINTRSLTITNGARVAAASLGEGNAGRVTINATEKVEVNGVGKNIDGSFNPTQISVLTTGSGSSGVLNIQTGQLTLRNGGQVVASTEGSGNGGKLDITAQEIQLNGRSPDGGFPSGLLARVEQKSTGNGGDLLIETGRLTVTDGARVAAASLTQLPLNPLAQGKAGNVIIRATDRVQVTGVGKNIDGSPNPTQISVLSTQTGTPGNLNITAPSIFLNNQGNLAATSQQGSGGNITLTSQNVFLRNQGRISADAGAGGKDGNIKITAETIVLLGGSKIITDAESPIGGSNITISAPNDRGLALFVSPDSLINAKGELTVENQVEVKAPEIPQVQLIDATKLVAQTCPEGTEVSTFYVTGRGGIPTSPNESLNGDLFWEDLRIPHSVTGRLESRRNESLATNYTLPNGQRIVEAQGWVIGSNGEVILTAETSNFTLHDSPFKLPGCR